MKTIKKRRRENKTDYKLRIGLLKSGKARIVVRMTNRYAVVQLVESNEAQDKVVAGVSSKELIKNGWSEKSTGSLKSIPSCYLTGLLMSKKIKNKDVILDIGMAIHHKGGRIYAVAKGLVDGGVNLKVDRRVFPSDERIKGEHLKVDKEMINKVFEKLK